MNKRFHAPVRLVLSIAVALALPAASFGEVTVMMSGGLTAAAELLPQFEKTTGIKVSVIRAESQGTGPNTIGAQLRKGVAADMVIMSREGLDELIAEGGRIVSKSDVSLAQTPLGLSVRAGAPKPDISTVDALRKTLLAAKSITFPSHTSGIYMRDKVLSQLGITSAVSAKTTTKGAPAIASGEAEIGILPLSELVHAPGTDFVGNIPAESQYISVFGTGIVVGAKEPEAAKKLIAFLTSEDAKKAIIKTGMEPPKSQK